MKYFTESGVIKIIEKYNVLIDTECYFDDSKKKHKLERIEAVLAGCGFDIYFYPKNKKILHSPINKFMILNKIKEYNSGNYEMCST